MPSERDRKRQIVAAVREGKKFGLERELIIGALRPPARPDAIEELSAVVWEAATRRRHIRRKKKETHLAIHSDLMGDPFINFLAITMLQNCLATNSPAAHKLLHVLEVQLDVDKFGTRDARRPEQRGIAMMLLAHDPNLKPSDIADRVGVFKSAVYRWLKEDSFQQELGEVLADPERMAEIPKILERIRNND